VEVTLCGSGGSCTACGAGSLLENGLDENCDSSTALKTVISDIRAAPADYYLRVDTGINPGGEVSDFLIRHCGWPV
jgi:ferredoxin